MTPCSPTHSSQQFKASYLPSSETFSKCFHPHTRLQSIVIHKIKIFIFSGIFLSGCRIPGECCVKETKTGTFGILTYLPFMVILVHRPKEDTLCRSIVIICPIDFTYLKVPVAATFVHLSSIESWHLPDLPRGCSLGDFPTKFWTSLYSFLLSYLSNTM
jgi:hypothetical protein